MQTTPRCGPALFVFLLFLRTASAQLTNDNCAHVIGATATLTSTNTYTIAATVSSPYETGWDQYADAWQLLANDGAVLGTRELGHPHETEQPFTRTLGGVEIPPATTEVTLRARDSINGYCGDMFLLEIAAPVVDVGNGPMEGTTSSFSSTSGAGSFSATAGSAGFVAGSVYYYGSTWP